MEHILLFSILGLGIASLTLTIVFRPKQTQGNLKPDLSEVLPNFSRLESLMKEDFRLNREEFNSTAKSNRDEISQTLRSFMSEEKQAFDILDKNQKDLSLKILENLEKITKANQDKLNEMIALLKTENKEMRGELERSFKGFQEAFGKNVDSFNSVQRENFKQLDAKQVELIKNTEEKLDQIRTTVAEKLEKTLSERLGQSFETVGKQLIEVQRGLGEMHTLAQDVGGLKKVLSNVKMRGGIGEIQLSMLLEQILAPEQYEANVKTKANSDEVVEFAIKLPGKGEAGLHVWLPVDAKFPKDVYETLQEAYEIGDVDKIEVAQKSLEATIKKMAKDISEKYIDPPNTTDFGIMFLPFEGIFAEVVRKSSLLEDLQKNYKITITGPTTLASILNSLQMGFKTLAIEKRSSEVWQVLGAVKKEFESFGGLMEKAQVHIQQGLNQLDDVMGKRTRAIVRKLKNVESMSEADSKLILSTKLTGEDDVAEE